jgi:hypothetical protein
MDEENPTPAGTLPDSPTPSIGTHEVLGDKITKGCLGCGCFGVILFIISAIYAVFSGASSAEGAIGGGAKFLLASGGGIVIVVLVFFLMRLDMIMAKFKN